MRPRNAFGMPPVACIFACRGCLRAHAHRLSCPPPFIPPQWGGLRPRASHRRRPRSLRFGLLGATLPNSPSLARAAFGYAQRKALAALAPSFFTPRAARVRAFLLAEGVCAFRLRIVCPCSVRPRAKARYCTTAAAVTLLGSVLPRTVRPAAPCGASALGLLLFSGVLSRLKN